MNSPSAFAKTQYEFIKSSGSVLFDYCKTIAPTDFLNQNSSFGKSGSIRNLLVHVANVYEFWVAHFGLDRKVLYLAYESFTTIDEIVALYGEINDYIQAFIEVMDNAGKETAYEMSGRKETIKPLHLFTHVITHEFHHKGQILSISRHLGCTPVDTNIIR